MRTANLDHPELDRLADAITALAGARNRIGLPYLLRETALNILILTRIASNRLPDKLRKEDIDTAADHLTTQLRHAAWELPPPPMAPISPPDPSCPQPDTALLGDDRPADERAVRFVDQGQAL